MYITNVGHLEELNSLVVKELRDFGIKHRHKKIGLNVTKHSGVSKGGTLFNRPLHHLPTEAALFKGEAAIEIPTFIFDACSCLRQNVETEGIFRKGGSAARQKEIKAALDQGRRLGQHHEIDVANVLKHFLRELPEPLLPYAFHEMLLRCLLLKDKKVDGLLLVCLLLPTTNLNTLSYLMGFLSEVASRSAANKMDVTNLAIVISPSVMPVGEKMTVNSGARLNNHVQIVELLIRNADKIGMVSDSLCEKVMAVNSILQSNEDLEKNEENVSKHSKRKKRRSGSLTRMLNGFKKMVGRSVESDESSDSCTPVANSSTPCIKSAAKRRGLHAAATSAFSSKKKRDVLKTLPQRLALASTPQTPVCSETCELYHHTPGVCGHPDPRKTKTPAIKSSHRRFFSPKPNKAEDVPDETQKKSRLSFRGRRRAKKHKPEEGGPSKQDASYSSACSDNPSVSEHKWGAGMWMRRKPSVQDIAQDVSSESRAEESASPDNSTECLPFIEEADVNLSDVDAPPSARRRNRSDRFVRIPKSEYEAIKNRVSAIEDRISQEFGSVACDASVGGGEGVQSAYEMTLEASTSLDRSSSDRLARRLSRDLKIRRSAENKVIRSPSARKIGSLRRRSKERTLTRTLSWQLPDRSTQRLRRGRPNTVFTGLPHPKHAAQDPAVCAPLEPLPFLPFYHVTRSLQHSSSLQGLEDLAAFAPRDMRKASSHGYIHPSPAKKDGEEAWQNAESFFNGKRYLQEKVAQTGRASIVKLLNENAGLVSERLKLFDAKGDRSGRVTTHADPKSEPKCKVAGGRNDGTKRPSVQHARRTPVKGSQFGRKQSVRQGKGREVGASRPAKVSPKRIGSPRKHASPVASQIVRSPPSGDRRVSRHGSLRPLDTRPLDKTDRWSDHGKENGGRWGLPDNLRDTIYDVCTPLADRPPPTSPSPLKDRNRAVRTTPYIKQPLLAMSPGLHRHPQPMSVDRGRRLNTPMKALAIATPVHSPRRQSPRLLLLKARNISKMY